MPDKLKYKIQLLESIQLSAKNTKQNRECGIRGFMDMLSVCITVVIIKAVIFCWHVTPESLKLETRLIERSFITHVTKILAVWHIALRNYTRGMGVGGDILLNLLCSSYWQMLNKKYSTDNYSKRVHKQYRDTYYCHDGTVEHK